MTPYGKGYHSPGCQLLLKLYCQYLESMGPGNNGEKEEWSHSPSLTVIDLCFLFLQLSVSWVTQSCPTLCNPMNHSTPGLPIHHQLPEFTQIHVHRVSDAIQPSHPLSFPISSCLQSFPCLTAQPPRQKKGKIVPVTIENAFGLLLD